MPLPQENLAIIVISWPISPVLWGHIWFVSKLIRLKWFCPKETQIEVVISKVAPFLVQIEGDSSLVARNEVASSLVVQNEVVPSLVAQTKLVHPWLLNQGCSILGGSILGGSIIGCSNRGGSILGGSILGGSILGCSNQGGSILGGSILGGSTLGCSNRGGSTLGGSILGCSTLGGSNRGDSTLGVLRLMLVDLSSEPITRLTRYPMGISTFVVTLLFEVARPDPWPISIPFVDLSSSTMLLAGGDISMSSSELELPSGAISELPSSAKHDRRSIYKTLKDRRHWRLHALSCATGVLGLVDHAPPLAVEATTISEIVVSRHLLGPRPPPTYRSSLALSIYGGKTSIGEITCLHAPEKVPVTMFTRPASPHLSKPRSRASELRFEKFAPPRYSSSTDLLISERIRLRFSLGGYQVLRSRMTGKCRKSSLAQALVQPQRLPSAEDDWQAKTQNPSLTQALVQPRRLPSAEVQDDWQAKSSKSSLTQASVQPLRGYQVLRSRMTGKCRKSSLTQVSVQPQRLPSAEVQDDWQAKTPNLA
uniref:Uncharacterized protein n=1 Tax=Fagus sylvatica TaxID=28930 RepID=A0A2N9HXN7_FAGSY